MVEKKRRGVPNRAANSVKLTEMANGNGGYCGFCCCAG
jgi:hypothetical protein